LHGGSLNSSVMREFKLSLRAFSLLRMAIVVAVSLWVLAACKMQCLAQNPYNSEFVAVKSAFDAAPAPQQAALVTRAYQLREFLDSPDAIAAWMNSISENPRVSRLVRDEAVRYSAAIDVHRADLGGAETKLQSLGLIRNWSVVGPFSAGSFDSEFGPDHGFRNDEKFTTAPGQQQGWRQVSLATGQLWIDLSDFAAGNGILYAASSVYSESAMTAALRFGSDSTTQVSINGDIAFAGDADSAAAFDQHAVAVRLNPGWNSILLKLPRNGEGPARFAVRITGLQGGGLPLKASATPDHTFSTPASPPTAQPYDLVDAAQHASEVDPNSGEKLEALGLVELSHGRATALIHLEAAARQQPSAERWLAVAQACADQQCKFQALNAALKSNPSDERAILDLADYYTERKQTDKARDLVRSAISLSPGDFVAHERLIELNESAGLRSLALKQSRELQQQSPGPLWLKSELAARYAGFGLLDDSAVLVSSALSEDFDNTTLRTLSAQLLPRRGDVTGLISLLTDNIRLNPYDTDSLAQLSELLVASGDITGAEHTLRNALAVAPDNPSLRAQLASLSSRGGARDPGYEVSSPTPSTASWAEPYLQNAAELASDAQRTPPATGASATALSDVRVEQVLDNGLSSLRVQQVYYCASEQGARHFSSQSIQYSPDSQRLTVLHARIYKADGRTVEAIDQGDSRVSDASEAMYYDSRSREVDFPGLEKGDVIELDYSLSPTTTVNPYGNYFGNLVVFRTELPEKLKRYVLITPSDRTFNIVEERMPSPAAVTEHDGQRIYRWDVIDAAALPNENRGPAVTEIAPYVHVSTFASWEELGHWYANLIRPQFKTDAALRDVAARLTVGKTSDLDKINAIYQFVLRNTRYVALEFGIYSYKPYPVTETYARRFGDCKDKASLMIALLRQAGIDADFVLLRTQHMGAIDPRAVSVALFDHAIVYLPKWDLWLDGTADFFSLRELPTQDRGAMALVVAVDGSAQLRRVPMARPQDNYTRRTVHAVVTPSGNIRFKGNAYTRGEDAPGLRREYEVPGRQRDSFRNSLAQVFPSVRVDEVRVQDAGPDQAVDVSFRGTIDTSNGMKVVPLAASWMQHSYLQELAPLPSRTEELILPAPWITEEELHFQLPAGAQIAYLPAATLLSTQFGTARIQFQKNANEVVIKTTVQFRALRIAPADYAAFREFCRSLELAFRNQVKVALPG
jgi:transglutaminase-like putative cysteine protease/cytochrome c-type biogenesis protein CcmH/NrfG